MKYFICEGAPDGEYNASSKPRKDVECILKELGYKPFYIKSVYGVQHNKLLKVKQFIDYYRNYIIWNKQLSKLHKGDEILIQYPIINSMIKFEDVIKKCTNKGIITTILVHDLDSLRFLNMPRKVIEDKKVLNACTYIIAHNKSMKKKLIEMGNDEKKIVTLDIFDYIYDNTILNIARNKKQPIIIAGNLSKEKAQYLSDLKTITNVEFNLYGKGYEPSADESNVNYKGAFLPEELLNNLEGSFGLVWDGTSKETCSGAYGQYLKYNNPHKTSLYLSAELPVIVWEDSAMADFVISNKVGIVVKNLDEIADKIKSLTDTEYEQMINNTKDISLKLRNGYYLKKAIKSLKF